MDISGPHKLGPLQIQPLSNSGPYFYNLGELYQRGYTCTYLIVAEGGLKNLLALKCEV